MGYPVDTNRAYLIESFGTIQSFRTFPHSGDDWTYKKGVTGEIQTLAVFSGTVRAAAFDKGAGNYVVLEAADGGFWLYGHHARNLVSVGQRVSEGQALGIMGTTGFSTGVHLHLSRYTNLKTALSRVVAYWVKGLTVDQWAAQSSLTRPSNYYRAKDSGSGSTSPTNPIEGFLMALSDSQQQEIYNALVQRTANGGAYYKTDAMINDNRALHQALGEKVDGVAGRLVAKKPDGSSYGFDYLPAILNNLGSLFALVGENKGGGTVEISDADVKAISDNLVAAVGPQVAAEIGKRLTNG